MKLGTQTASLTNHLLARSVIGQPEPVVGMGATMLCWTDRHACTIVDVTGDRIKVQEDKATRTDNNGMSESQTYTYESDPKGAVHTFRKAKNGMWQQVRLNERSGRYVKTEGQGLRIGERDEYRDFSF